MTDLPPAVAAALERLETLLGESAEVQVYSRSGQAWNYVYRADIMAAATECMLAVLEEITGNWAHNHSMPLPVTTAGGCAACYREALREALEGGEEGK